ncbi:amidase [Clostridium pascui]|uniref:acetamidase/formamidase family protein n=1 Tax=Clostridium pascui TaxID=46609 RepID=UPI00195984D5|nr:acetamidase/formamidase family protein [Clostridium pascui]MBM7869553.1 amidase [Clostridium pascui]
MKRILKEKSIFSMTKENKWVETAKDGDIIAFETFDCYKNQICSENQERSSINPNFGNPATGPLYIEGAEISDILKIEILDIRVAEEGTMRVRPNVGALGDIITDDQIKKIIIKDGKAMFNEKVEIPINPMIGVIGTAPTEGEIHNMVPDYHGGNMDCNRIVKGSVLYLPVNVKGALLSIGDLHAVMGDGEVAICGLEIPGEVQVKINVLKGKKMPLPMLVQGEHIMTIASAKTLDEASKMATHNMHKFMTENLNININEAAMLLSLVGNLRICQIVDPLKTTRMEMPLTILEKYNFNY